jgi:ribosomal protein L7/L12
MKVEKSIQTKITLYMDNGESSTVFFEVMNEDENEATFADAEICRQQLELAVEVIETLSNSRFNDIGRKSAAVYEVFEILEDHNVLKEVPAPKQLWKSEARQYYAEGKRIAGIKVCRDATGWGLKDSIDYCDKHFPRG